MAKSCLPVSVPATRNAEVPVTFAPHYGPHHVNLPHQEGGCPPARSVCVSFCACTRVHSCAPFCYPRFRPCSPIFPLILLVRARAGIGEEVIREGRPKVRKERVPPIRPRRKFDLMGISARADVNGVSPVRLLRETGLNHSSAWSNTQSWIPRPANAQDMTSVIGAHGPCSIAISTVVQGTNTRPRDLMRRTS